MKRSQKGTKAAACSSDSWDSTQFPAACALVSLDMSGRFLQSPLMKQGSHTSAVGALKTQIHEPWCSTAIVWLFDHRLTLSSHWLCGSNEDRPSHENSFRRDHRVLCVRYVGCLNCHLLWLIFKSMRFLSERSCVETQNDADL